MVMHGLDRWPSRVEQDGVNIQGAIFDQVRGVLRFRCTAVEQADLSIWIG